jgi:hypothetical protein
LVYNLRCVCEGSESIILNYFLTDFTKYVRLIE